MILECSFPLNFQVIVTSSEPGVGSEEWCGHGVALIAYETNQLRSESLYNSQLRSQYLL